MKTKALILTTWLLLIVSAAFSANDDKSASKFLQDGAVTLQVSRELSNVVSVWAGEFEKLHPEVKFNIVASEDKTTIPEGNGISFLNEEVLKTNGYPSAWKIVVGRDITVPIMNVSNPYAGEIAQKGLSGSALARFFMTPGERTWGKITGSDNKTPLHYYTINDNAVNEGVATFMKNPQLRMDGITAASAEDMIAAIQKDVNGLGFCKLTSLTKNDDMMLPANITIVPVDRNGNGSIDFMEDIYSDLQDFTRGVWIGKYPKSLSENIYAISAQKPQNEAELAFLNWILFDGQQFLKVNGYSDLVMSEQQTQAAKLRDPSIRVTSQPATDKFAILKTILLVVVAFTLLSFMLDIMGRYFRGRKSPVHDPRAVENEAFDSETVSAPKGLYYDKTHTWTFMEQDGSVKIGIDDFLQHVTGHISRVEMKKSGEKIKKGEPLITLVQKGKQLIIRSPLSGTIIANNNTLATDASSINISPYVSGWIYRVEPVNWPVEIQFMNTSEKYRLWLKDEFQRLKDFLASALRTENPEYTQMVLQDGGAIKDQVLSTLGPDVWEDFQTRYMDHA